MKKLAMGILVCMSAAVSSFAAGQQMVSQVTFFPLAYIGYHTLHADALEVGLGRSQSTANQLGNAGLQTPPFNVDVTVTIPQDGQLNLNGSNVFYLQHFPVSFGGVGATDGNSAVTFKRNLRIGGGNAYFKNLSADTMAMDTLVFYDSDHPFPPCMEEQDEDFNNMYWSFLKLSGTDDCKWYLTCGKAQDAEDRCTPLLPPVTKIREYQWSRTKTVTLQNGQQCNTSCLVARALPSGGWITTLVGDFFFPVCDESSVSSTCIAQDGNTCYTYSCGYKDITVTP